MKIKTFLLIIFFQLVIIILLCFKLTYKIRNILGSTSINPIKKENIVKNPVDNYKYFYEPKANSIETDKLKWLNQSITYTINDDYLNERFNYPINTPSSVFRIITLGDSFTFGLYVNTAENYSERLEDLLNSRIKCHSIKKFEVINLGVYGYDIQYAVERFKLRGQKYNPDLVIWLVNNHNIRKINELGIGTEKDPNGNKMNSLFKKSANKNDILAAQSSFFTDFNLLYKHDLLIFSDTDLDPEYVPLVNKAGQISHFWYYHEDINQRADYRSLLFPDGHPNEKGHQLIAQDLFNYLKDDKIIPCN